MSDIATAQALAAYPARFRPIGPLEPLGGAGGLSGARLWRYGSAAGTLVLRAWPSPGPTRARLERAHEWEGRAASLGFVPAPISDRAGRTIQTVAGRFWELAPWMPGAPETARPPAIERMRAALGALAAFHERLALETRLGASPGLNQRAGEIERLIAEGLDHLERDVALTRKRESGPSDAERRETATRWIALARFAAPKILPVVRAAAGRVVVLQPCLRDARPEHFLFEGDRVTGLVDFGAMDVDCVAGDLARLLGDWRVREPAARAEALAAYARVRPLAAAEAELIGAFELSTDLLIGEHWARWHYREHRCFERPSSVDEGLARGLERLAEAVS